MIDEFDKCRFCIHWDDYDGNWNCWCDDKDSFKVDKRKLIEKAKETGLRVSDIVGLIELG